MVSSGTAGRSDDTAQHQADVLGGAWDAAASHVASFVGVNDDVPSRSPICPSVIRPYTLAFESPRPFLYTMAFSAMALPEVMPLLPIRGRVLLPSSILRVVVASPRSLALVESLLRARATQPLDGVWLAVTSLVDGAAGDVPAVELEGGEQVYGVGCAARVLQVSRSPSRDRRLYVLLLEGRLRCQVHQVATEGPFYAARVSPANPAVELEVHSTDPETALLATAFRDAARTLVERLDGIVGKTRLSALLESAPPHRLADLFVAAFEERFDRRLAMLAAACPKERLRLARALLDEAAATIDQGDGGATLQSSGDDAASRNGGRPGAARMQRSLRLQQQLAALRKELAAAAAAATSRDGGEGSAKGGGGGAPDDDDDELSTLERRLLASQPPADVLRAARQELRKLRRGNEQSPGHGAGRAWIEWLAAMPWRKESPAALSPNDPGLSLTAARALLDAEHYGLDKVKQRVVEYLAVRKLRPEAKPAILCLLGPPGVGKTSLARSIANALGRPFVRVALGGVRDEAEIRGHRRTYVAAMPGRLVQALRRVGTRDPLILLDEVDKLGRDVRGDPASALLEVLDPEQNGAFVDHYLNVPLDLSKVTFLCTANNAAGIPAPLLDRLEVIRLAGYTHDEKVHIARRHIIPKLLRDHGLVVVPLQGGSHDAPLGLGQQAGQAQGTGGGDVAPVSALAAPLRIMPTAGAMQEAGGSVSLLDISDSVTSLIIEGYTREAGVRSLERALAALCRAVAVRVAEGDVSVGAPLVATPQLVTAALGPPRFGGDELRDRAHTPGVVAGLVWTEAGGLVQHVEASALTPPPGAPGRLQLTGTLGDVIKESAQIAYSWVRSRANALRLRVDPAGEEEIEGSQPLKGAALLAARDVHVHLPQGAVPKDGPSAGITLATALCSLFSGVPPRADTAMTGELTLSGLVLPVGGIRDKLMAAQRARLSRVLIPARNMADVAAEVPVATQEALTIIPVATMDDVLREAFYGGFDAATFVPVAKL